MTTSVYVVSRETPLDEVAATMAERKLGCAVVMQREHVVGILTTVDICNALAALLQGRLPKLA